MHHTGVARTTQLWEGLYAPTAQVALDSRRGIKPLPRKLANTLQAECPRSSCAWLRAADRYAGGMSTPALTLQRIGQIALNAKNIPAATAFYRDVLGLKHLFSVGDRMAFFDCGGVRLMLSQPSRAELDHPSSILYFVVADIAAAHADLVAQGVKIEQPPVMAAKMPDHELWLCGFRDPEGNILELMCEKR